jgi:prepilin-type N-terminal cleavage/methylation domain-containing protein
MVFLPNKKQRGFTIVELIVVVATIAVLSALIVSNVNQYIVKARDTKRKVDMRTLKMALNLYIGNHGTFPPASGAGCGTGINGADQTIPLALKNDKLLSTMPKVPSAVADCGDDYYMWTYDVSNKRIGLLTKLERPCTGYPDCGGFSPITGPCCYLGYFIDTAP